MTDLIDPMAHPDVALLRLLVALPGAGLVLAARCWMMACTPTTALDGARR